MTPRRLRVLVAISLVLAPLIGALGLRLGAHQVHTSSVRMGAPTFAAALIMGPRDKSSETTLQQMQPMDQFWFAFEGVDSERLERIAFDMANGENSLGPRTVACMSSRAGVSLELARADEVRVCVSGSQDDLEVPACRPDDWRGPADRLVLLSLVGQDARLDRIELIQSCQINARHWREWHQRQ